MGRGEGGLGMCVRPTAMAVTHGHGCHPVRPICVRMWLTQVWSRDAAVRGLASQPMASHSTVQGTVLAQTATRHLTIRLDFRRVADDTVLRIATLAAEIIHDAVDADEAPADDGRMGFERLVRLTLVGYLQVPFDTADAPL